MPESVYTDDREGAVWDSKVRDAGAECRAAFKALVTFVKDGKP